MAYTVDMPQKQKNSGMKTQRATCGCKFCFIGVDHPGNLRHDPFRYDHYHKQTLAIRDDMNAPMTKAERENYASNWL
jgi:hypothetical protein